GKSDVLVPAAAGEQLSLFERATVHMVEGAGHMLPWCPQPEMRSWILGWLEAQGLAGIASASVAGSFARAAVNYQASAQVQADIVRCLLDGFRIEPRTRAMDLGCGTGFVSQHLLQAKGHVPPILHVDLALPMLKSARRYLQDG